MGFFSKKKKIEERSNPFDYLMYNSTGSYTESKALLLSTVYRCVEVISGQQIFSGDRHIFWQA